MSTPPSDRTIAACAADAATRQTGSEPDLSIVIPAYNVVGFISAALTSALAQKGVSVEVVVIDDGSTDTTAAEAAIFTCDPRLRLLRQANAGLPAARNSGVAVARGRYVGFLDGDDLWAPDKARRHVELMDQSPGLDMTFSWWQTIDDEGRDTGRGNREPANRIPGGLTFEGLVLSNFAGNGSTVVCRRDALRRIGGFDAAMQSSCEDLDAWLRIAALREGNIGIVPEVLTSYRMRGGQMTRDWRRMLAGWETAMTKARAAQPARVARVEPLARSRLNRFLAHIAHENGEHATARRFLLRAWWAAPQAHVVDPRALRTTLAVLAEAVLPRPLYEGLLRTAVSLRASAAHRRRVDA